MASPRDYKNTIVPNWCPGCGDYGIQNAISAVCAKKGWANEEITLISGIGCSSRIGGYQYCYGAHTTHGRALPFAQASNAPTKTPTSSYAPATATPTPSASAMPCMP